jgi:hypothetical protein
MERKDKKTGKRGKAREGKINYRGRDYRARQGERWKDS